MHPAMLAFGIASMERVKHYSLGADKNLLAYYAQKPQ